jgi:diguanylate cyclase (GGDEF)-like protein
MRLAALNSSPLDDGWLGDASTRSYVVLRERDLARQRSLIAADTLALLSADALQRFELKDGNVLLAERYGLPLPKLAEQMQAALLPAALAAEESLFSGHPRLAREFLDLAARGNEAGISTQVLLIRVHGETHGAYAVHWLGRERPPYEVRSGFYHYWDTVGVAHAAADERARLNDELAELGRRAFFDPLTGLPNAQALERELDANSLSDPFSVLALDFDGLREANSALGYTAGGDLLIRTVGQELQTLSRPGEFTARMHTAGDEFVLLLPGLDERSAAVRSAELEAALDSLGVPETHRDLYKGASVGHASRRPGEGPRQVLGRAVEQMRTRKISRGRG